MTRNITNYHMKKDEALSSRWLPLILLFGAPPPRPGSDEQAKLKAAIPLKQFAQYISILAQWTNKCRLQYMKWEDITGDEWGMDYNRCKREAFDKDFLNWAYTLRPEEYDA